MNAERPETQGEPMAATTPAALPDAVGVDAAFWRRRLEPGERLIWRGKPAYGDLWTSHCYLLAGPILALPIFAYILNHLTDAPGLIRYAFGPLYLAMLAATPLMPWAAAHRIRHSRYALTNRRIIVDESYLTRQRKIMALPLEQVNPEIKTYLHHTNIDLGDWDGMDGDGQYAPSNVFLARSTRHRYRLKFRNVAEPYKLRDMINSAKAGAR